MTAMTRAVAILEALSDANVNNPKAKELMELFNNSVGGGASNENEAIVFLDRMGKHLSAAIMSAATATAKQDAQAAINAARADARDKIPPGIAKKG